MKQHIDEDNGTSFPVTWVILLVLAGFFALFMIPFSMYSHPYMYTYDRTHTYYTLSNITTNESFDHKVRHTLFPELI
jgi:hypothetical protein